MKRITSIFLTLALLISFVLPMTAFAAGNGWYEVCSTSPNGYCYLYSNASDRDGLSVNRGRYNNGTIVYVLDYYAGQDGKYNYCYVQTQDGKTGYMHDYAIRPFKPGEVIVTPKPTAKPTARPPRSPRQRPVPLLVLLACWLSCPS